MGFAEDKVKEHIRANLKKFQDGVRVAQMLHLRCFTTTDREEIASYEHNHGNNRSFWEFFQRLHIRQGWVEEFIEALREDSQAELAEELQQVYERHQLPSPRRKEEVPVAQALGWNPPRPSPRPSPLLPSGAQPAGGPSPAPSAVSPAAPGTGDYRSPVQETEVLSSSSEQIVRPKAAHSAGKQESSSPPQRTTNPSPPEEGEQKTTGGQPPSSTGASPSAPDHPGEVSSPGVPPVSLRPGVGSLTRRWDSGQQHAGRGQNGFVANRSRAKDMVASPTRTGAPNQPEENYYSSADDSPSAPGCPEERKVQASRGSQNKEPLGSPEGACTSPSQLQRQERAPSPASRTHGNLQTGSNGDRVPANATTRPPSGAPPLGTSPSRQPRLPVNQVGTGRASQVPVAMVSQPPPSDWSGCGSTDVIPPNSPAGSSAAFSDFEPGVTKHPVQEETLSSREPSSTHASLLTKKIPYRPSATRNNVFCSNGDDDDSLCKPDVLTSCADEPPEGLSGQRLGGQEYSGTSDRFRYSGLSLASDSLQVSDSSHSDPSGERCPNPEGGAFPGRRVRSRPPDASHQPSVGGREDNGSIRTFVHSVKKDASLELTGAPDAVSVSGHRSPGVSPDLQTGRQPVTGADAQPEGAPHAKTPPAQNNYMWLLAGVVASVAVVAFVLLKRK